MYKNTIDITYGRKFVEDRLELCPSFERHVDGTLIVAGRIGIVVRKMARTLILRQTPGDVAELYVAAQAELEPKHRVIDCGTTGAMAQSAKSVIGKIHKYASHLLIEGRRERSKAEQIEADKYYNSDGEPTLNERQIEIVEKSITRHEKELASDRFVGHYNNKTTEKNLAEAQRRLVKLLDKNKTAQ